MGGADDAPPCVGEGECVFQVRFQAFPVFDSEHTGAPVDAYPRDEHHSPTPPGALELEPEPI